MLKHLVIAALMLAGSMAYAGSKSAARPKDPTSVNVADAKWFQPFGEKGPNIGLTQGTFGDKNPTSFFVKFPAGADSGWHIHSHDYVAVVLKGTFTEQEKGEAQETELPVGTYFLQPGKVPHRNGCKQGGDECVVFVHFDKGADSTFTTPEGKPVPKAKPAAK